MSRIVLVDDEEGVLAITKQLLEFKGHEVSASSKGSEGLKLILDLHPDLAILDIAIPDLNGIEILKQVKKKLPKMPVIMLTGQADEESKMKALECGASLCLVKPVDTEDLDRTVREILQSS